MTDLYTKTLDKVHSGLGQGGVLEQIDKIFRKKQRLTLFEMLEKIDDKEVENFPVYLYKHVPQNGKKQPAVLRFYLPLWKNHDEIFWQSLGDYVILAVHRVRDLSFDRYRGRMKVEYFAKVRGRVKYPRDVGGIIRFRRMAERRDSLGEMSKEQAAIIGAAWKFIKLG
jgi:hypothetical protein